MDAKLFGLNRIMLSMSNLSEYGELLNALFRLALIAEALGLPSLDDASMENGNSDEARVLAGPAACNRYSGPKPPSPCNEALGLCVEAWSWW